MANRVTPWAILVALLGATALGCSEAPPPPPPPGIVDLTVSAAPNINPDQTGRPSPVALTVFQLSATAGLEAADFFQLGDGKLLGRDVRAQDSISITPGEQRELTRPLQEGAEYVAVVAAFRAIDRAKWKAFVQVPPHGTTRVHARIDGIKVVLDTDSR